MSNGLIEIVIRALLASEVGLRGEGSDFPQKEDERDEKNVPVSAILISRAASRKPMLASFLVPIAAVNALSTCLFEQKITR